MQKFAAAIMLAIGALAKDKPYAGGEISTKENFMYGRFTAMMKPSKAKGTWTAFYLYGLDFTEDPNNLDRYFMEEWSSISYIPAEEQTPFHTKVSSFLGQSWETERDVRDHNGFHRYEIEWGPTFMLYKIDYKVVRSVYSHTVENLREPQNLVMGIFGFDEANIYDPLGNTDVTTAEIDWVQIEDYDVKTGKFNLRWRDDFNDFNEERWAKSEDKQWPSINSTFEHGNVYDQNGKCILEFTEAYHESDDSDNESDGSDHDSDDESHHGSDHDSDDDSDGSDEESHHSGDESHEGSDHGSDHDSDDESHHSSDDESHHSSDDESGHGSDHGSDHDSDDESHHGSDHDSDHLDGDFHVLPPPKSGSLDMAIEKATRVGVTMVRMQLDNFSNTMSHFLQ